MYLHQPLLSNTTNVKAIFSIQNERLQPTNNYYKEVLDKFCFKCYV